MPYEWTKHAKAPDPSGASLLGGAAETLTLWPYRSLSRQGFVTFISATALLFLLPLLAVLGTPILWGLLPFLAAAIALVWFFLQRSYRDADLRETLTLSPEALDLVHIARGKPARRWSANPYWVRLNLYPKGGPVPQYLTLRGPEAGGREVELGAFLSEEERLALHEELGARLSRMASAPGQPQFPRPPEPGA